MAFYIVVLRASQIVQCYEETVELYQTGAIISTLQLFDCDTPTETVV